MAKIFSGLDKLGFNDIDDVDLYKKNNNEITDDTLKENSVDELSLLYDKKLVCPVCGHKFTVKAVKTSSYRMKGKDSDFFIRYNLINPYFYDIWLCDSCGYAAMKVDFQKVRSFEKDLILNNITSRWKGRTYKLPFDVNIAIERYKIALLNYFYLDSKPSKKALTCLKIAWMYRIKGDKNSENNFLGQSLKGFEEAYFNEDFPIYSMNRFTVMYLIGELNRRLGNDDNALKWFSNVLTTPNISQKLKEMARDQKDLIKKNLLSNDFSKKSCNNSCEKKGFFSSLFNKY